MKKQWRCFHCDEVFTRRVDAAEHFGVSELSQPACRIKAHERHLVVALRKAEKQLDRYRAEDSDVMRAIQTQDADHRQDLIRAEERGYAKGLNDGRALLASGGHHKRDVAQGVSGAPLERGKS